MQISLVLIRKYKLDTSHSLFLQKLRSKIREPYFDNKNKRRLDKEAPNGTIYADEYDTFISLRNEVINKQWIVFKTLVFHNSQKNPQFVKTLSYPGHYASVLALVTLFGTIVGIYSVFSEGNWSILLTSLTFYIILVLSSIGDYKSHHDLIQECIQESE